MKRRRNVEGKEGGMRKEEGGRRTEIFSDNFNVQNKKVFSLLSPPSSLLPKQ